MDELVGELELVAMFEPSYWIVKAEDEANPDPESVTSVPNGPSVGASVIVGTLKENDA